MSSEKGFSLTETILALALLGIVSAIFLGSIGTETKATLVTAEQVTSESLVRGEIEYIKAYPYQYSASEYPIDQTLNIPRGWHMPNPTVEALHEPDDGIQKVTITIQRDGEDEFSAIIYKVER